MKDWQIFDAPEVVTIIGGGSSAKGLPFDRLPGVRIGVNDSAILATCDVALSMDRLWTEGRWKALCDLGRPAWIRRSAIQNIWEQFDENGPDWLRIFECNPFDTAPSFVEGFLNGTNSGMCAFNLALRFRPRRRIILVGFDFRRINGEAYWYPAYPWAKPKGATTDGKYRNWSQEFAHYGRVCRDWDIEVLNASPQSALDLFKRVDPASILT